MKLTAEACVAFERDINLFIDHELPAADTPLLVEHLESCGPCRDYVDDLRELASLHRELRGPSGDDGSDAAVADLVDRHALFASITKTLLLDKREELVRLLYELGKAYVLAGNEAAAAQRRRSVLPVNAPVDVRGTVERGRRLAREGEALSGVADAEGPALRSSGSLFRRSRRLFVAPARAGAGALANGHRLLLEALQLRPDFDEARLYLGFHHMLVGRYDRARLEFRRVYRQGRDPVHRMMALQFLGNVYSSGGDYRRAIECYEEVVASGLVEVEPRFFTSLVNLAVSCAKAGLGERCVSSFTDLVARFPSRVEHVRALLARKQAFLDLLARKTDLRDSLRRQVPGLFAA
jgi:tetratricopeptide (TPR) repeat protein